MKADVVTRMLRIRARGFRDRQSSESVEFFFHIRSDRKSDIAKAGL